jgi:hypothetical protein
MLLTYVVHIRGKLQTLLGENLNLLNGMHEGLLMLSFKERSLRFASTPAARLLNQLPEKDSDVDTTTEDVSVTEEILHKPIFKHAEVSIATQTATNGPNVSGLTKGALSLHSIVDQQIEKQFNGQNSTQTYKTWIKTDPANPLID